MWWSTGRGTLLSQANQDPAEMSCCATILLKLCSVLLVSSSIYTKFNHLLSPRCWWAQEKGLRAAREWIEPFKMSSEAVWILCFQMVKCNIFFRAIFYNFFALTVLRVWEEGMMCFTCCQNDPVYQTAQFGTPQCHCPRKQLEKCWIAYVWSGRYCVFFTA